MERLPLGPLDSKVEVVSFEAAQRLAAWSKKQEAESSPLEAAGCVERGAGSR
jgi:hypothetical protein